MKYGDELGARQLSPKKADFVIWGRLAGWNDLDRKHHWHKVYDTKKREMKRVLEALMLANVKSFNEPVSIGIVWIEPDFRRDPDNIASGGLKIILDALVHKGIIPNDTRRWIKAVKNEFAEPCKKDPCVIVTIETYVKES